MVRITVDTVTVHGVGRSLADAAPRGVGTVGSDAGGCVDDPRLTQACREFEAIFIETVFKSARAGLPKDGLFSSHEQEIVNGMLDAEMARTMSQGRGIGLAEFIRSDIMGREKRVKTNAAR